MKNDPVVALCTDGSCRTLSTAPFIGEIGIVGSVGAGGINGFEDVRTIQDALNEVPPEKGGPPSPIMVDGSVGNETIGAIKRFQKTACRMPWPDGRLDPGRISHRTLAGFYLDPNPYTIMLVYLNLPEVRSWVLAAQRAIDEAVAYMTGAFAASTFGFRLADKYFHIDSLPKPHAFVELDRLRRIYDRMVTCISTPARINAPGTGYFQVDKKDNQNFAYTYFGGFSRGPFLSQVDDYSGPVQRQDAIYVCTRTMNPTDTEVMTLVLVHELGHFVGPVHSSPDRIDDYSYREKPNFFKLSPFLAFRTADCIAFFAGEAKLKTREPRD
jgi:hypothetical protein